MKNKIIIISQAPLTPQINRNTYFSDLLEAGYNVQFWDVSQILHKGVEISDQIDSEYTTKFNDLQSFENKINKVDKHYTIFTVDFSPSWKTDSIFKILYKFEARCIRIDMYANTCLHESILEKVKILFTISGINRLRSKFKFLSYKCYSKFFSPFKFVKVLSSSKFSYKTDYINHPDYDEFIRLKNKISIINKPFILFIDTFFGQHPDLKYYHRIKHAINIQSYFNTLNRLFEHLEKKYKIPVVIAAHPKATYSNNIFNNRKIIKYSTLQLILDAKYVIAQVCNTFSWLSLAKKSVALVATNDYIQLPHLRRSLRHLSKQFDLPIFNLDTIDFEKIEFKQIHGERRDDYVYSYLTSANLVNRYNIDILKQIFDNIDANHKEVKE